MGVLQRFERRIESLVNRPFAKAFRAEVQPVEVASALQREIDDHAHYVARGRTMVPNVFVVELGVHDFTRLLPYATPLGDELGDMVREHAQDQEFSFIGPVQVGFERADDLATGMFRVRSTASAAAEDPRGAVPAAPRPPAPAPPAPAPPAPAPPAPAPPAPAPPAAARQRPTPYLEIDGARFLLTTAVTVIGRGSDADLQLDDPGVSRRHAQVNLRQGPGGPVLEVVDLGSTNGIRLDGRRVGQATAHPGDVLTVGSTDVVFRSGT